MYCSQNPRFVTCTHVKCSSYTPILHGPGVSIMQLILVCLLLTQAGASLYTVTLRVLSVPSQTITPIHGLCIVTGQTDNAEGCKGLGYLIHVHVQYCPLESLPQDYRHHGLGGQGRGERTTCVSTAASLKLRRANARRPLTYRHPCMNMCECIPTALSKISMCPSQVSYPCRYRQQ